MATGENKYLMRLAGWAGLIGAVLVGCAEFLIQFNPAGGYGDAEYHYLEDVSSSRLTIGYFLAVLAAPLYIVGYWHLEHLLKPAGERMAAAFFLIGAYGFAIGAVWLGERAFLAFAVQAAASGAASPNLVDVFAAHNEPLVNVLRFAMVIVSAIWTVLILRGNTLLPRWMAICSPAVILGVIFALGIAAPSIGAYILPIAMNLAHVILFALALATCRSSAAK